MVRRDELWMHGVLAEARSSHGQAVKSGNAIVARDAIEDQALGRKLRDSCDAGMDRLHRAIGPMREARVRGVVTAWAEVRGTDTLVGAAQTGMSVPQKVESTITIRIDGFSIVTTPEAAATDYDALKRLLAPHTAPPPPRPLPIVWRNGSAAVLLHEAIGHAAEHRHKPLSWPRWLRARDVAGDGKSADLIAGELPLAIRRESFRDVPLRRMTDLVIEQERAPFELPHERIEVHLVSNGAYEPLTEMIAIDVVVADLVTRDAARRLSPFAVRASRSAIVGALVGATGDPIRYPGVICSREGQELFVGSHAPVMVTSELV